MGEGERGVRNGRNSKGRENWRRRTTERERERDLVLHNYVIPRVISS